MATKRVVTPDNLSNSYFDIGENTSNQIEYKLPFTISRLKTSTNLPPVVFITDNTKEGLFEYDNTDTTTVGDDVDVIVTNAGRRYKRRTSTTTEVLNKLDKGYTISQLRALSDSKVNTIGLFYCIDSGKEGWFKYDSTDTSSADNLGTILVTSGGKRLKRIINDGNVYPEWFGAVGDNTINDRVALEATFSTGKNILFNKQKTYLIDNTLGYLTITNFSNTIKDCNLIFTDNTKGGIAFINCHKMQAMGISVNYTNTPTIRTSLYGIFVDNSNYVNFKNVEVNNTSAAGFLFNECIKPVVSDVRITNTLADGLHFANCEYPIFHNILTENTNDDGIALVNYSTAANYTGGIGNNLIVKNSKTRGITVVGQSNVIISNFEIENTSSSGLYVAYESSYLTRIPSNVKISNGVIKNGGSYLSISANRFGIEYSGVDSVEFNNINVYNAYSRGLSGVTSNTGSVTINNVYIDGVQLSDGANIQGYNVNINNLLVSECLFYGIYIANSTNVITNGLHTKNVYKSGGLNRAIWFENNNNIQVNGITISDNQNITTGYKIGTFGTSQIGTIQGISSFLKNGNLVTDWQSTNVIINKQIVSSIAVNKQSNGFGTVIDIDGRLNIGKLMNVSALSVNSSHIGGTGNSSLIPAYFLENETSYLGVTPLSEISLYSDGTNVPEFRINTGNRPGDINIKSFGTGGGGNIILESGNNNFINIKGKLKLKTGSDGICGTTTLSSGIAIVSTTAVTANSGIKLTVQETGQYNGRIRVSARNVGTSFTIQSSDNTDTCVVYWEITN